MKYILLITIAAFSMSCKNTNKVNANTAKKAATESSKKNTIQKTDLTVSFISLGAGVDLKIKAKVDDAISEFEKSNNIKIVYEREAWGREGEFNYNFDLKNLSTSQKEEFLKILKETIGTTNMVHIKHIK